MAEGPPRKGRPFVLSMVGRACSVRRAWSLTALPLKLRGSVTVMKLVIVRSWVSLFDPVNLSARVRQGSHGHVLRRRMLFWRGLITTALTRSGVSPVRQRAWSPLSTAEPVGQVSSSQWHAGLEPESREVSMDTRGPLFASVAMDTARDYSEDRERRTGR